MFDRSNPPARACRRLLALTLALTALGVFGPAQASAGLTNFTGVEDQNWYVPQDQSQCLRRADGYCLKHTYTFVSSNDCCANRKMCAILWGIDFNKSWGFCDYNVARYCHYPYGYQLDCDDQDWHPFFAGMANNQGYNGSTFLIRGRF
jgi:hypothetical protein